MTGQIIFAVLIALAALAFASERAVNRVREAKARYKATMTRRHQQVDRIRRAAAISLELKRELRAINRQVVELQKQVEKLNDDMRVASRPENRVFILDERRTPADESWIATVAAPAAEPDKPRPPWAGNRRFLVWAPDEIGVRAKVERRYQTAAGFQVVSVAVRQKEQGKRPAPAPAS